MPIHSCTSDGQSGEQWGGHGKCYHGPGAARKAAAQAAAAHAHGFHEAGRDSAFSRKVAHLYKKGYPQKQAVAIAYKELGEEDDDERCRELRSLIDRALEEEGDGGY